VVVNIVVVSSGVGLEECSLRGNKGPTKNKREDK